MNQNGKRQKGAIASDTPKIQTMSKNPVELYSELSCFHHNRTQEFLESFPWQGNETVLDIGCGDGRITADIAQKVPQGSVLGVDMSRNVIEFARQTFPPDVYPNLQFEQVDFRELNYHNQFDVVVSIAALHYIRDRIQIVKNIKNALKPSGTVLLMSIGLNDEPNPVWEAMETLLSSPKWQHIAPILTYGLFTKEEYVETFQEFEMEVMNVQDREVGVNFQKREEVATRFQHDFLSVTNRIPPEYCIDFIQDFANLAVDYVNPKPDEGFRLHEIMIEIIATKLA